QRPEPMAGRQIPQRGCRSTARAGHGVIVRHRYCLERDDISVNHHCERPKAARQSRAERGHPGLRRYARNDERGQPEVIKLWQATTLGGLRRSRMAAPYRLEVVEEPAPRTRTARVLRLPPSGQKRPCTFTPYVRGLGE